MDRARIASDGNEFLLVWSPDQDSGLYATPLDRFGAARGATRSTMRLVGSGHWITLHLLWADTRYLLLQFDASTRELEVTELDREGNVIDSWDPVTLPAAYSNALRQVFWVDGALQIIISTPDRNLTLAEVTAGGHLRMVGDFFDLWGPAEHTVPGHGGWYSFHPRQLAISFWSDQLERKWTVPLMPQPPLPPGVAEPQADNALTLLAPLANGSLLVGWISTSPNSSTQPGPSWHRLAVVSPTGGVVLGEPTSIPCSGGWGIPLPGSGSDATILFNVCGNMTMTTIDPRTANVVESIPLTGLEQQALAAGLVIGSAGPLALTLSYEDRRLSAFLLGSSNPTVHHPARLAPEIAAISVSSDSGRTTAAWIETGATENRIFVRRTSVSQPGLTLMSINVPKGATSIAVGSSPTTDLVVWVDGGELKVQRFDPTGYPIDAPFAIGTPGWYGRVAIAWNGFSFLVVWEYREPGVFTPTRPLFQAAVVPETGLPIPLGLLPLARPSDWEHGFGSEAPSLGWNGREFLLTFLGFADGCITLCPPTPRLLFAVRLDTDGRPLGDLVRIEDAEMPPFPDVKGTPASSVASDGGEFLITHGTVAAAQLIRVETGRGTIEVESVEEIFPWGVAPGLVTIESGEEGAGYAIAIQSFADPGEWLFLDRLDTSGEHLGRRAHTMTGGGPMDVALVAGTPLAAFRAVLDGRRAAFVATPLGSVAPPPVPAAPEAWVRREPGAFNYVVEWTPVDGATGYIVTIHFGPWPYSPNEQQGYILRRWIGPKETQFHLEARPDDRFTVQAIGPHGASEIVDAARVPVSRRRIVAR